MFGCAARARDPPSMGWGSGERLGVARARGGRAAASGASVAAHLGSTHLSVVRGLLVLCGHVCDGVGGRWRGGIIRIGAEDALGCTVGDGVGGYRRRRGGVIRVGAEDAFQHTEHDE